MPNDRFKSLNENKFTSKQYKGKESKNDKKLNDKKNIFNRHKNSSKKHVELKKEFETKLEDFPELFENKSVTENVNQLDYSKQTWVIKEEVVEDEIYKNNWTILTKGKVYSLPNKKEEEEISPYYNPDNAEKILENRINYRLELNDILGDISPYWDWNPEPEFSDDDEDYDNEDYDDSDEEYVEDW